jgi:hypothetical protein
LGLEAHCDVADTELIQRILDFQLVLWQGRIHKIVDPKGATLSSVKFPYKVEKARLALVEYSKWNRALRYGNPE